ncbi:MAG: S26 family signal peptidase [Rhizobiaceae bacterium]
MSGNLPKKLIYNASASAPIGLYWLDNRPLKRCDLVLVHVPKRMRDLVQQRGYLPPNTPLLKRVVGIEGDRICRRRATILVNGSVVAEALEEDELGRDMPRWEGCRTLTETEIFLLQPHPQSFDGRYFGPVNRQSVIGRATYCTLF